MNVGAQPNRHSLLRFRASMPLESNGPLVTLGEGDTPLVRSTVIGPAMGMSRLYFKLESSNPTGSYKDRIAAVGVSRALQQRAPALVGTSSGNAGASMAAYAARAGIPLYLFVLETTPPNKLHQVKVYGASTIAVRGFGMDPAVTTAVFEHVRHLAQSRGWAVTITANAYAPEAMEGVKTLSYEVCEGLSGAPDWVYVPVGGGGLLASSWKGFREAVPLGLASHRPRMAAVHPEGVPYLSEALREGTGEIQVKPCTSEISGLQVPLPPDAGLVLAALRESNGVAEAVSDEAIYQAQRDLCMREGILAEPAGATALAGLRRSLAAGRVDPGSSVVCYVTGHGLKDMAGNGRLLRGLPQVPNVDAGDLAEAIDRYFDRTGR